MMTNDECRSSFGCHVAEIDVAPGWRFREMSGGGGHELAHLGSSWAYVHLWVVVVDREPWQTMVNNNNERPTNVGRSSFGCHAAVGDVAPG
jgi:hypothetical protein